MIMATTKKPVRKTRTRKAATAKGLSDLVAKPSRRTRSASQPSKGTVIHANRDSGHRYSGLDNKKTSAYSIGGLDLLGLINMTGKSKSIPKATRKEVARAELHKVFGKTMVRYWIKNDWIEQGTKGFKITVNGLNRISDRLENPSDSYGTTPELIGKMQTFLKTGKGFTGRRSDKVTLAL